jgi:hypothetical protein
MPRPKRWFHVSQDINYDSEFELLCKKFGLGGVRFFLQVMSILDKTDNHWSLHKDFDLNVLARCCGTKPKIILGSYQLLVDMKWISIGVDEDLKQFIFAPNYMKYRGNRVHEKEKVKPGSCSPPYLPFPLKEIHKEKRPALDHLERNLGAFEEFWKAYPKKVGKEPAKRVWGKMKPDASLATKILEGVKVQKLSDQWKSEGGKYIPNPATWLNQKRWTDEPLEVGKAAFDWRKNV